MKIPLTKEHVLTAVREETRLRSGAWIRKKSDRTDPRPVQTSGICSVCAVGAVLLPIVQQTANYEQFEAIAFANIDNEIVPPSPSLSDIDPVGDARTKKELLQLLHERARALLDVAPPLTALTVFFEGAYTAFNIYDPWAAPEEKLNKVRELTLAFVEQHFPETFEIEVEDCLVAPGYRLTQEFTDEQAEEDQS